MDTTWIPIVLSAFGTGVAAFVTWRGNVKAKKAQDAAELEVQRSVERVTELRNDLKRLQMEALAISTETAASPEEQHDAAGRLAKIASDLADESIQLQQERVGDIGGQPT